MDTVYITGHRNPDTDSIVSAMAYAALKNALGGRQYKAARLGQVSDETQIVLDQFDAQPPELIHNVRTQVRDLVYDTPPTLSPAATISRAWQMMQADHISVMPVCNEDGTLYGMLSAGKITEEEYVSLENTACPGCGSCSYLGTANTMCALAEALGMTLPDGGTAPATSAVRMMKAEETGVKIMELVEKNITARQIITDGAVRNAIKACLAMSGSTNAVMHLTAIAYEAELGIKVLNEFDTLSDTTPQLAKMNPACKYSIVDFYKDGGVPRLMENLQSMLETDVMTVTAHTLAENIRDHKYLYPATGLVNHTLDDPFGYTGGVAVLRGNLAPDTGITKPGAFDKSLHHFKGEAICFDSEEAAEEAILAGKVHDGHVVVIRYEGPKGGPGMREMYKAMKYLYGRGLSKTTALITDGRFSGTNNGCFVGHISPEAAEGGPIAIVRDGDLVEIDVDSKKLELLVPQEEIEARLKQWKRPEPKFKKGWLGLYCKLAASGSEGGVMKFDQL